MIEPPPINTSGIYNPNSYVTETTDTGSYITEETGK